VYALIAALPGNEILGRPLALVFVLDAASFVVSAFMIARLSSPAATQPALGPPATVTENEPNVRFRDAFRLPLVRAVMPATVAVALGLGALFSLGIEFVRTVLHASDAEFGVLVALFGVGAAVGLVALQRFRELDDLRSTRLGVFALGLIVACFSLAPAYGLALMGALAFGAAVAWTLASGMAALQSELRGRDRVIAFAAFHIVIRSGFALSAVGAGAADELVGDVRWPLVGRLESARLVLLCSGVVVALSAARVRTGATRNVAPPTADSPLPPKGARCQSRS